MPSAACVCGHALTTHDLGEDCLAQGCFCRQFSVCEWCEGTGCAACAIGASLAENPHYEQSNAAKSESSGVRGPVGEPSRPSSNRAPDTSAATSSPRVVYRDPRFTEMIAETKGSAKAFAAQLIRDRKPFTCTPTQNGWTFEVEEHNEPNRWEVS